jgi:hypothetical protein
MSPRSQSVLVFLLALAWFALCRLGHGCRRAAEVGGTELLVRVPAGDSSLIRKVRETGVKNVIVPRIDSAAELRRAFGDELSELPARRLYGNAYAGLAILEADFLGLSFDVYFQMNADDDRLQQVLLETGRRRAGPAW